MKRFRVDRIDVPFLCRHQKGHNCTSQHQPSLRNLYQVVAFEWMVSFYTAFFAVRRLGYGCYNFVSTEYRIWFIRSVAVLKCNMKIHWTLQTWRFVHCKLHSIQNYHKMHVERVINHQEDPMIENKSTKTPLNLHSFRSLIGFFSVSCSIEENIIFVQVCLISHNNVRFW